MIDASIEFGEKPVAWLKSYIISVYHLSGCDFVFFCDMAKWGLQKLLGTLHKISNLMIGKLFLISLPILVLGKNTFTLPLKLSISTT